MLDTPRTVFRGRANFVQWVAGCKVVARDDKPEARMTASVFIGTSVDGFIARPNGDLDFLPEGGGEPHGYNEFMASVDALVIGRKTLEQF
jgi:hypothetical protein